MSMIKYGLATMMLAAGSFTATAAPLSAGKSAPAFSAPASLNGIAADYSLTQGLSTGPVVVYFYPSAFTGGCNLQAHLFSENSERFAAAGASVVGVSLDSIDRLNAFSADPQYCAGKVRVASDLDGTIARRFGLQVSDNPPGKTDTRGQRIDHARVERTTFVVGRDGRIIETISGVSPTEHVSRALQIVEALLRSAP